MATVKPPTNELGGLAPASAVASWGSFVDTVEHNPELVYPRSLKVFDLMRNDSQIDGLLTGIIWPVMGFGWHIDPNGAPDDMVEMLAEDLLLPIAGSEADGEPRRKNRFDFAEHMEHALDALIFGHYYFEQVGEIVGDRWRLRKLAPRPPDTIAEIKVAPDGGLVYVRQNFGSSSGFGEGPEIPVSRLVAYVWGKRGAQWTGRSILRSLYANWLIKDRLIRVDAIKHERNGMGIPVVEAPPGARPSDYKILQDIADQLKVGESGGATVPPGSKLRLVGTEGSVPNTIESVVYHDQQMARRLVQMVAQLGQQGSTGNRALGDTLGGMFDRGLQAIAKWYAGVFNAHVIEDWVDWNWPNADRVPRLSFSAYSDDEMSTEALAQLVSDGIVTMDSQLEDWVRARHGLPPKPEGDGSPFVPSPGSQLARSRGRATSRKLARIPAESDDDAYSLPSRTLRRHLFTQEVAAAVDWKGIDEFHEDAVAALLKEYVEKVRPEQIKEISAAIANAESRFDFLKLSPETTGADLIEKRLKEALKFGAKSAADEAARQGQKVAVPALTAAEKVVAERASVVAGLMSQSAGEAAGRRALALSGGSASFDEIAKGTTDYLESFSNSFLQDRFNGLVGASVNEGRMVVFDDAEPEQLYASELLDTNTCSACAEIDGTEYADREAATSDYPYGGFKDCLGGDRCRGTIIAVFEEQ